MRDQWNEQLRCPVCGKTGTASLSQDEGSETLTVDAIPRGFKAVDTPHGPTFHCDTCDVEVNP